MNNTDEMIERAKEFIKSRRYAFNPEQDDFIIANVLAHFATSQRTDWIPTSEKLPDEEGYYEVSTTATPEDLHHIQQGLRVPYVDKDFYSADDKCFDDLYVYAWRPVSKPAIYNPTHPSQETGD